MIRREKMFVELGVDPKSRSSFLDILRNSYHKKLRTKLLAAQLAAHLLEV